MRPAGQHAEHACQERQGQHDGNHEMSEFVPPHAFLFGLAGGPVVACLHLGAIAGTGHGGDQLVGRMAAGQIADLGGFGGEIDRGTDTGQAVEHGFDAGGT